MTATRRSDAPPEQGSVSNRFGDLQTRASATAGRLSSFHASMLRENARYALLVEIVQAIQRHQPSLLAKQAAYSLLYAVPSVLIVLVSLAAIVDKNTGSGVSDALQRFIAEQAPDELQPLLASLVQNAVVETSEQAAIVAALVSIGIAVWSGAGGVGALVYAINAVYDIRDTRPFFKGTALKLGLMFFGGLLVVASFVLLAFGRRLGEWLVGVVGRGTAVVNILSSGPVWALFLLACSLLLIYWLAPDISKSFRWILPGTVVATVAMVLVFAALDLILTVSNPGSAFGAVGSVLILLWTLFIISAIVIVGAIVNAVIGRRFDRTLALALRRHPEKRLDRGEIAITEYR